MKVILSRDIIGFATLESVPEGTLFKGQAPQGHVFMIKVGNRWYSPISDLEYASEYVHHYFNYNYDLLVRE